MVRVCRMTPVAVIRQGLTFKLLIKEDSNIMKLFQEGCMLGSEGENLSKSRGLRRLLEVLPLDTVEYACAYGSGAVSQAGENTLGKMVDFIVATRNSERFHEENLRVNSRHYSALHFLGHQRIAQLQKNYGARVYCNTLVTFQGQCIKYSVTDVNDLLLDLIEWKWLYLAGRLQKHVIDVIRPSTRIISAMNKNRRSALQAVLLLSPDKFTLEQLYTRLVSLSYRGDFRMYIGEDKNKIKKIVEGSKTELDQIYIPFLEADEHVFVQNRCVEQDTRSAVFCKRFLDLPLNVLWNLQRKFNENGVQNDIEEIAVLLARQLDPPKPLETAIQNIVAKSAWQQSAKNVLTAGIARSIVYSFSKIRKMFKH